MRRKWCPTILAVAFLLASFLLPGKVEAQGGRPILTVRSYSVQPTPVRAGQEFTVTIDVYNNGSRAGENTLAIFTGGDFLPVGDAGHLLWQLHINHTATVSQKMRAPAMLTSGVHLLKVDLSANDYEGNHYDYPQTIPVEVVAPSSGPVSAPPKVVIEAAQTEPALLSPGAPFTLTLHLSNQGDRAASHLFVGCTDALVVPTEGSALTTVSQLAAGEGITVTLPLMLAWDVAQGGRQGVAIGLEYSDSKGGTYKDEQIIGVEVGAGLAPNPQVTIEAYATEPESPAPGESFTLTLRVSNVGTEAALRLQMALGGTDGSRLEPFLLRRTGHALLLGDLEPGESLEVGWQLAVDAAAESKAYALPIALSCANGRGQGVTASQSVSLIVKAHPVRKPQVVITAYHTAPDTFSGGDALTLTVEIANVGSADAQGLLVALGGKDGGALEPFVTTSGGNVRFLGTLGQGQTTELVYALLVDGAAQAKAYNLPVALAYTGPGDQEASDVQRLSLVVRRRVELQAEIYSQPELIRAGTPAPISLEVLNVGRGAVDIVGIRATGLNMGLQADGTPFVGPLDPGGSAPLDLTFTATRGGALPLTVHVEYRDDLNRVQTWSRSLTFQVEEEQAPGPPAPDAQAVPATAQSAVSWQRVVRALRGFLGFGS